MKAIIIISLTTITVISLSYPILIFLIWISGLSKTAPKITFKSFKKFYCLCPSKWSLEDTCVIYYPESKGFGKEEIYIDFKYLHDCILYRIFKKKIEKNITYENRLKKEKKFIEYMQKDINIFREENIKEMKRILNK